jgi:hypothetical protein
MGSEDRFVRIKQSIVDPVRVASDLIEVKSQ